MYTDYRLIAEKLEINSVYDEAGLPRTPDVKIRKNTMNEENVTKSSRKTILDPEADPKEKVKCMYYDNN